MRQTAKFAVIGQADSSNDSTELAYARWLQQKSLPSDYTLQYSASKDFDQLVHEAKTFAIEAGFGTETKIIIIANPSIVPERNCVKTLSEAVGQRRCGSALAFSSKAPYPDNPIDYFTISGIERYARRISTRPLLDFAKNSGEPSILFTTLDYLVKHGWRDRCRWIPGAFAHDYSGYHDGAREEILLAIPEETRTILDVGGGSGGFLRQVKSKRSCQTTLIEQCLASCKVAENHVDRVYHGNFLEISLAERFDCITFLDVLEHTEDPIAFLKIARNLLAANGTVVSSIPNVGHWSVVSDLLEGRWDYGPAGIHCITHLRFFTRQSIVDIFRDAGFNSVNLVPVIASPPEWFKIPHGAPNVNIDSLNAYSYTVIASAR